MSIHELAIIGGGPAGLAAATFALGVNLDVVLIAPNLGGKVNLSFQGGSTPNPVWGAGLVKGFVDYIESHLSIRYHEEVVNLSKTAEGIFQAVVSGQSEPILAKSVIIATGVKPQRLFIPGEQEFWGRGLSYSALSHATLYRGGNVAVIGHGERALIAILQLASLCKEVYWLPTTKRRCTETRLQQVANHPKVTTLAGWSCERIVGEQRVKQLEIVSGYTVRYLDVDAVFVELGLLPKSEFAAELLALDAEEGTIPVNQRCETQVPGLFAAGDVTNVYAERVTVAIGEGSKAAISAWEYLAALPQATAQPVPDTSSTETPLDPADFEVVVDEQAVS